ncbi:MAG: OsmC family protein [Candidatus Thorarchaeota archaeon]|nr:OsmC family protein [Candidatus Thorarchaeota archaeon]
MAEPQKEYRVKVTWTGEKSGKVQAEGRIEILTGIPPDSDGVLQNYTPEELFVAAGTVCFMNSFVYFAKKMHIEFKSFEVDSVGMLEQVDRSFEVTQINSKAKLVIESEDLRKKFERALELGAKYCFVSNSMKCPTHHENEIIVES